MGMAASQARFLGLTARQTNLQFEGQQINQQRTTLSNQSANCYNSLLAMTVPVPPCTDDFTKLVYTFTPTVSTTATIDQIFANNDENHPGTFKVIYTEFGSNEGIIETTNRARITNAQTDISATLQGTRRYFNDVSENVTEDNFESKKPFLYKIEGGEAHLLTDSDTYSTTAQYYTLALKANNIDLTEVSDEATQNFVNSKEDTEKYYEYELNGVKYYVKKSQIDIDATNPISVFTTGSVTSKKQKTDLYAKVEYDNQARVSAIIINRNPIEGGSRIEERYTVTSTTEVDEESYNNAYNQYIYEQYLYDQKQTEINASIEIIQSEDKNLELRLKQLDTENNAIQTEIEAVSKVLKNNIEGSFKTFNA
ncbi:hypothetical protein IJI31_06755 [bacterium]|nr:hypothetical protein [bacterium]